MPEDRRTHELERQLRRAGEPLRSDERSQRSLAARRSARPADDRNPRPGRALRSRPGDSRCRHADQILTRCAMSSTAQTRPLAVITGASSGIGYELARKFASNGYDLVIAASNPDKLREAARSLSEVGPRAQVEAVQTDLSKPEGVRKLYDRLRELGRPVDVLAANAGVGVYGEFTETALDAEIALIDLNITSQVHLIKLVVPEMKQRRQGDILITSSIAGTMPGPHYAVYAASKAFMNSFGQAIRNELSDAGVNVTVLMPGLTDTEFFERAHMEDSKAAQGPKQSAAEVADAAFEGLQNRDDHVVPGLMNKMTAGISRVLSEVAKARAHGRRTERRH
jgi:uncharacterized protein